MPHVQNRHQHLYGKQRWRDKAKAQLHLQPLCQMCLRHGVVMAAEVADHIEPHQGDEWKFWRGELQSLCKSCHDLSKKHVERLGFERGCDEEGLPIDPNHPFNHVGGGASNKKGTP